MRRGLALLVVLAASGLGLFVPSTATSAPTRSLGVTGTEVGMYPAFEPATTRYAATTTDATAGELEITAGTTDPDGEVLVDGNLTTSATTTVSGLSAGDEVSVVIDDAAGRTAYSVMYLPAGFPVLNVTTNVPGKVEPGLVALTLNTFSGGLQPSFGAIVDRNGVPVYAVLGPFDTDLKQQPNGEITVSRATVAPAPHTGYSLVTLDQGDRKLPELAWRDVAGDLTNTDGHDSVRLPDGSTILIGYEPNLVTGKTDATIQKLDASGTPTFTWNSGDDPSILAASTAPTSNPDYAHINSVVSVEDGDVIASFRHLSAAYRIATVAHDGYQPGDVIWKLGGTDSTFTFPNDPEGGPCAQHTVSELPNGHILLFDNGTSAFCVDAGSHGFTRAAEYVLDTTAKTATLVWTYEPGKYSLFAGSARRMANGDTLIGWAADRSALATEVDSDGQTVWELKAADPPAGQQRYATYRAELVTALAPQPPSLTGPADGASFVVDDAVPVSASCADWLGDPLPNCPLTGVTGGLLDTTTVGAHTWLATATDGAGNSVSVTRHYTVRSGRRPDGLIRKAGSSTWKGGNLYGATGQTVQQHARRRHTATAFWKVQNDGERADAFVLDAPAGTRRFKVHYFAGRTEVTSAVVAGTYRSATLAPGSSMVLRVEVTPTRRAHVGRSRTFRLHAVSAASSSAVDVVATHVTVRR